MNTSLGQLRGFRVILERFDLAYLRDKRAAAGAVFIQAVDRDPETTFGTAAQIDALLDHHVNDQHRTHTKYCENDNHLISLVNERILYFEGELSLAFSHRLA